MTYDNFTDAQLRARLAYHNERISIMLSDIEDLQGEIDGRQRSIEMRNEFIVEHDKRKAAIRDESRRRARPASHPWFDTLEERVE